MQMSTEPRLLFVIPGAGAEDALQAIADDDCQRIKDLEVDYRDGELILQRRVAKYGVSPFVFGYRRAIQVRSWQYLVRFKLFAKITPPNKPSL